MYQIFVRSFSDSDGDGIGDLKGIEQKIGYLKDLGIGGIWLTPIAPSPTYHKYDVTDYCDIDKEYGTKEDFKRLLRTAHKNNIKIVVDFVANHTSTDHPWFKEGSTNLQSKYRNYYVWDTCVGETKAKDWYQVSNGKYYAMFWRGMPDLNFDNKEVRSELKKAASWWIDSMQVDGFRVDAAQHIYPDNLSDQSAEWWVEFAEHCETKRKDFFIVGEVWNHDSLVAKYYKGLSSNFHFSLSWNLIAALKNEKNDSVVQKLKSGIEKFKAQRSDFVDAIFLSNHDGDRIRSLLSTNIEKTKLAARILYTLPGLPFVYYGEELGMLGAKPDEKIREPFPWGAGDKNVTRWQKNEFNNAPLVISASEQKFSDKSMLQLYKQLLKERNSNTILTNGDINVYDIPDQLKSKVIAYTRTLNGKRIIAVHNLTSDTLDFPWKETKGQLIKTINTATVIEKDQKVSLLPNQSLFWQQ